MLFWMLTIFLFQDVETRQDEDNHANDEEEDPPPVMRRRSGSYTLSEPSPLLRAYMDRYGEGDMSFSSSSSKKKEPKMTAEEALGAYLESISRMPGEVKGPKIPQTEDKESEQFAEKEKVSEKVGNEDVAEVLPEAPAEEVAEEKVEEVDEAPAQVDNPPENAAESPEKSLEEEEEAEDRVETPVPPSESVTLDTLLLKRPGTADTFASSCITVTEQQQQQQQQHQQQIESAVSTLAQEQRRSVLELVEEQERQRRALNEYFREQQQKLIEQVWECDTSLLFGGSLRICRHFPDHGLRPAATAAAGRASSANININRSTYCYYHLGLQAP